MVCELGVVCKLGVACKTGVVCKLGVVYKEGVWCVRWLWNVRWVWSEVVVCILALAYAVSCSSSAFAAGRALSASILVSSSTAATFVAILRSRESSAYVSKPRILACSSLSERI